MNSRSEYLVLSSVFGDLYQMACRYSDPVHPAAKQKQFRTLDEARVFVSRNFNISASKWQSLIATNLILPDPPFSNNQGNYYQNVIVNAAFKNQVRFYQLPNTTRAKAVNNGKGRAYLFVKGDKPLPVESGVKRETITDPDELSATLSELLVGPAFYEKIVQEHQLPVAPGQHKPDYKSIVEKAVQNGELQLYSRKHITRKGVKGERETAPLPAAAKAIPLTPEKKPVELDFIEVVLEDDQGVPVANKDVVVVDAEGTAHDAKTDDQGKLRLDNIAKGQAEVTFKEVDQVEPS